jgi:glycosyltransferase involved in cell wall biosynthesis
MRLTLVSYSLGAGGAERIVTVMANYWAERGWAVTLLTLVSSREEPFFALHPAVVHRPLDLAGESPNALRAVVNNAGRLGRLRRAIAATRPECVLSFMDQTNVLTLLATMGLPVPVIVSEQIDPYSVSIGAAWDRLRHWLYARAAFVILQSERSLDYFSPRVRARALILPNPIALPAGGDDGEAARPREPVILAVGRLFPQKGFDLLLRAFAQVAATHPDWRLEIWGEGPLRADLEALRRELGLERRACLPGRTPQPREPMLRASLFALSSRFEGFPTVVCEALACGLPVVSFDCRTGPREIIRDGIDGLLVPPEDGEALAAALGRLIEDEPARRRMAAAAPEVLTRFGVASVMPRWERLIQTAMGR